LDRHIDNIVQAASVRNIRLVWIGPPCAQKAWDSRGRALDDMLSSALVAKGVQYVSMRDEQLCSGSMHEPDGVHLKLKGYAYMWEKARVAAQFPAVAVAKSDADKPAAAPAVNQKPAKKHARKASHARRSASANSRPAPTKRAQLN